MRNAPRLWPAEPASSRRSSPPKPWSPCRAAISPARRAPTARSRVTTARRRVDAAVAGDRGRDIRVREQAVVERVAGPPRRDRRRAAARAVGGRRGSRLRPPCGGPARRLRRPLEPVAVEAVGLERLRLGELEQVGAADELGQRAQPEAGEQLADLVGHEREVVDDVLAARRRTACAAPGPASRRPPGTCSGGTRGP